MNEEEWRKRICMETDTGYSYDLAKRMEQYRTNPVLGYRTAGSRAEFETGGMLVREMESLGLADVHKDRISVDSWEFEKAVMLFYRQPGQGARVSIGCLPDRFPYRRISGIQPGIPGKGDGGRLQTGGCGRKAGSHRYQPEG